MELINILLVEDNPADIALTREVFQGCRIANQLQVARDGIEALEFLRGSTERKLMPDVILLDLNMPRMDGREVLRELKNDDRLCTIPVIVMTTSDSEQDVLRSYQLGANCYITKPVDLNQFVRVVNTIEDFWLAVVKLPSRPRPLSEESCRTNY